MNNIYENPICNTLIFNNISLALPLIYTNQRFQSMDREISKSEQSKNKFKRLLPFLVAIVLFVGGYYLMKTFLTKKADPNELHIVEVEKGNIRSTFSAVGLVIASSERVINSPISTEIENVLLTTGAEVKKGDVILKLDKEFTAIEYERLQDELALRTNNIEKLKFQYDKDLRDLDYQDQIKALKLSEIKAQLSDQKRLLDIGGATAEEVEAAELQLNIAQIEKKILENELQFKRQVNSTDKNQLQLEFDIQKKRLRQLGRKLKETQVTAPHQGVITWINDDIGKTVNEGEALVKIANLNRFEIEATTSDRNSKKLQLGLPVEVRINKERLNGTISRILPEIINNTVKFYVELENNDHKSLRPNMRSEIYVIIDKKENVLRAKRGAALVGTQSQYIYKVENEIAKKIRITKGLVSSEYFEIVGGLSKGDQIIISETKDFDHMDSFSLISKND